LLKIDVEGFELDVLQGAKKLMDERKIQKIIFEYNPEVSRNLNKEANEAFDYLIHNGFEIHTLEGARLYEAPIHMKVVDLLAIRKPMEGL
jgi:hypothetical protein